MKVAQRMALAYYRLKFRTLGIISKRLAARSVFRLFCTPYSGKPKRKVPKVFQQAQALQLPFDDLVLQGWRWTSSRPNGRKILIVHGFDSCSYRFDRYVTPLTKEGFEVTAFDAPGHGCSGGKTVNGLQYSQAIIQIDREFGPFYGIMAHSLGGLAAALAYEKMADQEQRKLALIAPTTETASAIDNFFKHLRVSGGVKSAFIDVLEQVGNNPVSYFSLSRMAPQFKGPVLWIHDEDDMVCAYNDTLPVQAQQLPNVEFLITKGLGHSGIYRHNTVFKKIMGFFSPAYQENEEIRSGRRM